MKSCFNQKSIDEYQLNAINYMEKFIMHMFSESFTNDIVKRGQYRYEHHNKNIKKIDKSKGITHDDVCDCNTRDYGYDSISDYLKPYKDSMLIIENLFEDMIEKIIDKGLSPMILKDYLESFKNDPDHFEKIFLKAPDFYNHYYKDNDKVMVVAPNITNKDKEEAFLFNYL